MATIGIYSNEKEQREIRCYGCTEEELKPIVSRSFEFYRSKTMVITSWLSDVQELISFGKDEQARQLINQVKFIVNRVDENGNFVESK